MASTSEKKAMKAIEHNNEHEATGIPCCLELLKDDHCDVFNSKRILNYPVTIMVQNRPVQYEVIALSFILKIMWRRR